MDIRIRWLGMALLMWSLAAGAEPYTEETLRQADPISGEQTWQQYCAFCHTLRKGQAAMTGPNLFELFRRKVGSAPGFTYSDALRGSDRQWTPDLFARYVQNPAATLPGNAMPAVDLPADKVLALTAFVMRASGSVDWDLTSPGGQTTGGPDASLREEHPAFWAQYMTHTIRFTLPHGADGTYTFVAYFNEDGTITGNNRGLQGIWRLRDKRNFCYALERVGVHPYEWLHCLPPTADDPLEFGKVLYRFSPVKGHDGLQIAVSFIEGRPHPLEGDAHPDYWTFLFNNTSRYEIRVGKEVVIVDAQFHPDRTISSPQGVTGSWRTEGNAGKDDRMCYRLGGVPGVDGDLTECFALVLMFNPRVGARWPSRFDQGNTYWAEIVEGHR